ncbi:hypothetical protein PI124_g23931, partial [Phytophthora idaei]
IKNPDLKGLVGGSQQRASNPIFDVIVELDHVVRGRCRIIWDVAKAVDSVLECNGYSFETRRWDASTQGVQVTYLQQITSESHTFEFSHFRIRALLAQVADEVLSEVRREVFQLLVEEAWKIAMRSRHYITTQCLDTPSDSAWMVLYM